ncbi:MAG: N-acetylglucosamine-6-phosphate deacetylase, partial [Xanthomonadaceae bacterium]|nr:N-acetylglucosamine-6-phosphate deacetylase [Xanthomonadaceae bacterium]
MLTALTNARVLLDGGFADAAVVLIDGARIVDIVTSTDLRLRAAQVHDLHGLTLGPGFIDCQVNGGGGALFNDAPSVETIRRIAAAHRRFGTTGLLPTLISDDIGVMRAAIGAVREAMRQ